MQHFIDATKRSLRERNHYAALAMTLALPDICGWISDPNAGSRARYVQWFDGFLKNKYVCQVGADHSKHQFLTGNDFYALRCAFLHEGRDDITDQRAQEVLTQFQFTVAPVGSIIHCNQSGSALQLQVDVFCEQVLEAVAAFVETIDADSPQHNRLISLVLIRDEQGKPV